MSGIIVLLNTKHWIKISLILGRQGIPGTRPQPLVLESLYFSCCLCECDIHSGADPEIFERGGPEAIIYKILERGGPKSLKIAFECLFQ